MDALDIFALNEMKCVIDKNMALLISSLTYTATLACEQSGLYWGHQFMELWTYLTGWFDMEQIDR